MPWGRASSLSLHVSELAQLIFASSAASPYLPCTLLLKACSAVNEV